MRTSINKFSRIILATLVISLLIISLTSCGLFSSLNNISKVSIEQKSTWEDANNDGILEVELGKYVNLLAKWDNGRVSSPSIQWYLQKDGREKEAISGATEKELKYKAEVRGSIIYSLYVTINGVDCDAPIKFIVVDAKLDNPTIECKNPTLTLAQGVIQQNLLDGVPEDVNLFAYSNFDDIAVELKSKIEFAWKVDGVLVLDATTEEFTYDCSSITEECLIEITCELSYEGLEEPKLSSVKLEFIKNYKPVNTVSIEVSENKVTGTNYTYYVEGTVSNPGSITLNSVVTPSSTDLSTDCKWEKIDSEGIKTIANTGRSNVVVPLKYGKNVFVATIDNIKSREIIVYSLTTEDYASKKNYIERTFIWDGSEKDYYLSNQDDLNALVGYIVSMHKNSVDYNIYIANATLRTNFTAALNEASSVGVDESGSFSFSYTTDKISLSPDSNLGNPTQKCINPYTVTQAKVYVRYNELAVENQRTSLPVDFFEESMTVSNSNQLFRAVSWGYKPNIIDENLNQLYQKARAVLLKNISANMTDLEKVKVIYDWIVNEIDYDKATLEAPQSSEKYGYNAFFLEGVFNDECAVCDGKSKAFALLCGMEGIKAERIMGYADNSLGEMKANWEAGIFTESERLAIKSLISGNPATQDEIQKLMSSYGWGHAWNKVLVDANGDGVREWYVVDTTWGDVSIDNGPTEIKEYLSFDYFLIKDSEIETNHYSFQKQEAAITEYDQFGSEKIQINSEEVSLYVTSNEQLQKLKLYFTKAKYQGMFILIDAVDSVSLKAYDRFTFAGTEGTYVCFYVGI